jgi:hypothetical protein
MANNSVDQIFDSIRDDKEKLTLTIESIAATDPTLQIFKSLKPNNRDLFLNHAKQNIFNTYLTKYGVENIATLPEEKVNIWVKNYKFISIVNHTNDQIDMCEQLVRHNYISAQPILLVIIADDKAYGGTKYFTNSVYDLFETCLYSISEFDEITWGDYENLSQGFMKIVARFFVNREHLMSIQNKTSGVKLQPIAPSIHVSDTTNIPLKHQSHSNKMKFMANLMNKTQIVLVVVVILFVFVWFLESSINGTCEPTNMTIKTSASNDPVRTINYKTDFLWHEKLEVTDKCKASRTNNVITNIECPSVPTTTECHARTMGHGPWEKYYITLGANPFVSFFRNLVYVEYGLILFAFFYALYWKYYERDLQN